VYSTQRIKAAAATLTVGFLLAIAFAATAQPGNGTRFGMTPQQWKADQVRGDAMNRYYHLGAYSQQADELKAARVRGQAMNRYYHLGTYRLQAQAQLAEERRGQAANQYYHLGRYAVVSVPSRFDWADAGIGAGAMLGAILLAGGLAVTIRRRPIGKTSFPSTT
jgi:hypothetical protein